MIIGCPLGFLVIWDDGSDGLLNILLMIAKT